nr:hypothetical protein [Moraxella osloensis]
MPPNLGKHYQNIVMTKLPIAIIAKREKPTVNTVGMIKTIVLLD